MPTKRRQHVHCPRVLQLFLYIKQGEGGRRNSEFTWAIGKGVEGGEVA